MNSYQVLLYYKYVDLEDPERVRDEQHALCESLGLKGRIIVAYEGINGTIEGVTTNTEKYIQAMEKNKHFKAEEICFAAEDKNLPNPKESFI